MLPVPMQIKMAASTLSDSVRSMARRFEVDKRSVPRMLACVAEFQVVSQVQLVTQLTHWLESAKPKIEFAAASLMFDETGQQMKILMPAGGSEVRPAASASRRLPKIAKVEICAGRNFYQWLECDSSRLRAFELVMPPLAVPTTSAKALWAALRGHPLTQPVMRFKRALLDRAVESGGQAFDLSCTDAASGNDLLFAAECIVDDPRWAKDRILCMNHQNHHTMMVLVHAVVGIALVSALYTMSSFLRMGTYLLRCVLALRMFLRQPGRLNVVGATAMPADPTDGHVASSLIDYLVTNFEGSIKARQKLQARLHNLLGIWNYGYARDGVLGHRCRGPECCPGGLAQTVDRLAAAIDECMLARCPVQPSTGKWTQLGLCLDWWVLALTANVFTHLFGFAMRKEFKDDSEELSIAGEGFLLDYSWKEVAGKRKKKTQDSLSDQSFRLKVLLMAILLEPGRRLTTYYLSASHDDLYEMRTKCPPLVDLLNPSTSLAHHCLQYWSTLLGDPRACPRLLLAMQQRGCASFTEWFNKFPEDITLLKKGCLALIAATERRQVQYLSKHFGVFSLCDGRLPEAERLRLARHLASRNPCCVPAGVQTAVLDYARTRATADSKDEGGEAVPPSDEQVVHALLMCSRVLFLVGWFLRLSVACIERMHKMHRDLSKDGRTSYPVLAAKSVLTRCNQQYAHWCERQKQSLPGHTAAPGPGHDYWYLKRALAPSEVFKKRLIAREAADGIKRNPTLPATRKYYEDSWAAVDIEEEVLCDQIAEDTKAIAKRNKSQSDAARALLPLQFTFVTTAETLFPLRTKAPSHTSLRLVPSMHCCIVKQRGIVAPARSQGSTAALLALHTRKNC